MCLVDNTIKNCVGERRIWEEGMPLISWKLAGNQK